MGKDYNNTTMLIIDINGITRTGNITEEIITMFSRLKLLLCSSPGKTGLPPFPTPSPLEGHRSSHSWLPRQADP